MKITIEETKTTIREVELPKYFKEKDRYYMAVSETHVIQVTDKPLNSFYMPGIVQESIDCISIKSFEQISETEFRNAFLRVSLAIEETLNN